MGSVSLIDGHIDGANTCVVCGRDIPEGRQVCIICGHKVGNRYTNNEHAEIRISGEWMASEDIEKWLESEVTE